MVESYRRSQGLDLLVSTVSLDGGWTKVVANDVSSFMLPSVSGVGDAVPVTAGLEASVSTSLGGGLGFLFGLLCVFLGCGWY